MSFVLLFVKNNKIKKCTVYKNLGLAINDSYALCEKSKKELIKSGSDHRFIEINYPCHKVNDNGLDQYILMNCFDVKISIIIGECGESAITSDDELPAGWDILGYPIKMKDLNNNPNNVKNISDLSMNEKHALTLAIILNKKDYFAEIDSFIYSRDFCIKEMNIKSNMCFKIIDHEMNKLQEIYSFKQTIHGIFDI